MSDKPPPIDNDARILAATDLDTTLFVEAAAGTGKTTALVARVLTAVTTGRARLHDVVAITFTEKAAGELKLRVREELEKQLTGDRQREALSDLERTQITTIHSFCASILRERPVEAKVDPQFAVADDLQRELLLDEAWTEWLEGELSKQPVALRQALMREVSIAQVKDLATLLVDNRSRLAAHPWPAALPLDVTSICRQLTGFVPALERSLKHSTAKSGNFHQRAQALIDVLPQLVYASQERTVAVLSAIDVTAPQRTADFDSPEAFREAKATIKEIKAILAEFATAAGHNFLVELAGWLQGFVTHFQRLKHTQAVLDFDDLLEKTRDLLRDDADVCRQLRQRYRFMLVDEFQDTDPVQSEIVLALGGDKPGKLFIVGDPKQSIYGFRRADIEMYAGTRTTLEKSGVTLQFQQNFRSRSTILDWVNAVFAKLISRPTDGEYQPDYISLKPAPQFVTTEPRVTLLRPKTIPEKQSVDEARRAEAHAIAGYLHQQVSAGTCKWRDVALLFRSFTGLDVYGDVFVATGVPFRVVGGRGYYQRQEIQTLVSLLCCLDNPNDKLNLVAVLRSPLFGWTDELIFLTNETGGLHYLRNVADVEDDRIRESFTLLRELHEQRHQLSVAGFVERVFAATHICQAFFACGPDGQSSVANLLKALELAWRVEAAGIRSLRGFVRQLRTTLLVGTDEEPAPANEETDDVVRILTMHKSKGLEFRVVVLADLAGKSSDSGPRLLANRAGKTFELRFAKCRTADFDVSNDEQDKRDEAEEIRLLYVAATRAKERLVIPWFAEKGERLDLLRRGFEPVASDLVEVDFGVRQFIGALEKNGKAPASRRTPKALIDIRRLWQSERAALLARVTKAPDRVTPSKLAHEPESREEEPTGVEREQAMDFGVAVHSALEALNADAAAGEIEQFIVAAGLSDADKTRAVEMVQRALRSELVARAGKAEQCYRESPFAMVTPEGMWEGKIDLLFCEHGRWVLVDYKTDARPDAGRYGEQMRAYERALKQVVGITVAEKLLFFIAADKVMAVA